MLNRMLRKKKLEYIHKDSKLRPALSTLDLILMGIGAIIGAGVFILTGIAAATKAGPAVVLSYVIAGIASLFAALAYAELAASIGGTGSAYTYAFTGFGEFFAWIIGWDLLLEYILSTSTVAIGWSGYVNNFLQALHIYLPPALINNPFEGGIINLPAFLIIVLLSLLLAIGVKLSAKVNAVIVAIKLITIATFLIVALGNIDVHHWQPFLPFGWQGVMQGAALVFFAYIGFDALSTTIEEAINPQRSVPIAIITSLVICTIIYILVSALLTGIAPYYTLNVQSPVAEALYKIGYRTISGMIAAGAIAGLTTVMLVMYYGLTRICLAITRDGLLPSSLAKINSQTHTPVRIIILMGTIMGLIASLAPITKAAELVNIGTLAAFTFVCAGAIVFRITHPNIHRPFKLPFSPFIPLLGIFSCMYLMLNLPLITWLRFGIWAFVGFFIYFFYGQKKSVMRDGEDLR